MEEELDAGSEAAAAEQESAAAAAAAGEDGSSLQVTWSTPFSGFQAPGLEELYKLHKHATNLSADWGCAGFILLFMAALCLRLVWETDRWNTCGYILYLALKLVAYVPLLAGRTRFFIRWAALPLSSGCGVGMEDGHRVTRVPCMCCNPDSPGMSSVRPSGHRGSSQYWMKRPVECLALTVHLMVNTHRSFCTHAFSFRPPS
jgi:hypothetical protein